MEQTFPRQLCERDKQVQDQFVKPEQHHHEAYRLARHRHSAGVH
jgi:hypothetical protein